VKIKAAGGIHTVDEARSLLQTGADRLGTSSLLGAILAM
jgi:deoxyribose-phosphate aldolase